MVVATLSVKMKQSKELKMRRNMKEMVLGTTLLLATTQLVAGGKATLPAVTPIVPIAIESPMPLYIGLGAVASFIERDPCCDVGTSNIEDSRGGAIMRIGWDFNQYVGVEARALKTFGSDVFSETTHYGLFLKPQYHLVDSTNVYGLLGYGRTTVDYTNGLKSSSNSANAFSYGVGFEYDFSKEESQKRYDRTFDNQGDQEKGWGLWVDYQHLLDNEWWMHTDNDIITAGITYDF